ncbi:hypothetical protein [Caballeronia sp. GACF4]|uniref:hypothetical protein n=1 Tax=Caballeronia sp. GACF4 TaxID=2921763 RepID=UPI00202838C3|nr:hypothetical protein [Caballeronia sp. GACF4]
MRTEDGLVMLHALRRVTIANEFKNDAAVAMRILELINNIGQLEPQNSELASALVIARADVLLKRPLLALDRIEANVSAREGER